MLAPREGGLVRPDENWVYRCWTEGVLENGLADVMDVVYSQRLATIIIHCNWSFYHPGALRRLVGELRAAGRVVFIDMHSTSSGQSFGWRVSDFVDALRMADRVMVHQPADFDRVKSVVPEAKVVVEPLGISMTHERDSATSEPELVGCFGFCFPNKGIEQLVMAASLLREKRPELRLLLLNAEHPLEISRQTVASIRALIDDLGLGDAVTFVTDFLDEQECMRRLARTSLIVNPYRRTTESASAAVRYALASETPVLVTPLRIFDDLGDAVFRARGTEPEALSEAMDRVLDELADRTRHARQVEEAADRWRQDHDLAVQTRRIVKRAEIIAQNNRRLEWSRFCTLG